LRCINRTVKSTGSLLQFFKPTDNKLSMYSSLSRYIEKYLGLIRAHQY